MTANFFKTVLVVKCQNHTREQSAKFSSKDNESQFTVADTDQVYLLTAWGLVLQALVEQQLTQR